jgi:hypothetical protein
MVEEGYPLWPEFVCDHISILAGKAGQQTNGVAAEGKHLPAGQL